MNDQLAEIRREMFLLFMHLSLLTKGSESKLYDFFIIHHHMGEVIWLSAG